MIDQTASSYDDEITLLDILVTLAESWKLLLFGPLITGVLAGSLSFFWPKTYESVAIVRMTEEEVAFLHAATVLDPLIEKFGLLAEAGGIMEEARQGLKSRLIFVVNKNTKLATITAKGRTPEGAQVLGQAVIDMLLIELQPKGKDKELILQEIAINNQLIADGVFTFERQNGKPSSNSNSNKEQVANLKLNNFKLNLKLQAKGKEVFIQEPSLPQRNVSPKHSMVVLLAILASGTALLIFVFVRKAWVSASQDVESASKIASIKQSFGLEKN